MELIEVTELLGDGISPELNQAVKRVAEVIPLEFKFHSIDWSLPNREQLGEAAIDLAEESLRRTKLALKYPTTTKLASPNAAIRRRCGFSVIYRPAISIRGIDSNFKENVNLHIVRVAVGGTYDDPGQLIGKDAAVSLRMVEREPCAQAAVFAFELARKKGLSVTTASKHTIQRVTDGLFESVVKDVHRDFADVNLHQELFDALLAKIIIRPEDYEIVLVLNEYGDFLSDMASGLVGSIGTGASGNYAFDSNRQVSLAMFDPAGGTAPDIAGKNICNPTAMLLSFGMLLDHINHYQYGHALRLSLLHSLRHNECTADLGGTLSTTDFVDNIANKLSKKLLK